MHKPEEHELNRKLPETTDMCNLRVSITIFEKAEVVMFIYGIVRKEAMGKNGSSMMFEFCSKTL